MDDLKISMDAARVDAALCFFTDLQAMTGYCAALYDLSAEETSVLMIRMAAKIIAEDVDPETGQRLAGQIQRLMPDYIAEWTPSGPLPDIFK